MLKACAVFFLIFFLGVSSSFGGSFVAREMESRPGPDLLYPTTDNIDLSGKDTLEFRWVKRDQADTDYYEFKLYKGYVTSADSLFLKQNVTLDDYPVNIPLSKLEKNQVYTWVLTQVFLGGKKSDKSFSSFRISG